MNKSKSDEERNFFILGSPRSGTSLVSRMLDSHANIVIPQETLFFKMFTPLLKYYGDLSHRENQTELLKDVIDTRIIGYWSPRPTVEGATPLLEGEGCGPVLKALIMSTAQDKQIACWGEKTPGHVFYWRSIKKEFPDAKIIHIVRDGRDVASSFINARMGPTTFIASAILWCRYLKTMKHISDECTSNQFLEVKYEALLDSPKTELIKICSFLGTPYSDSMLQFYKKEDLYTTDAANEENLQKPLLRDNKEKWRESMSTKQLQIFETIAGGWLEYYGYPLANTEGPASALEIFTLRWIISPYLRFFSRARDTKGQKEFLSIQTIKFKRILRFYLAKLSPSNSL